MSDSERGPQGKKNLVLCNIMRTPSNRRTDSTRADIVRSDNSPIGNRGNDAITGISHVSEVLSQSDIFSTAILCIIYERKIAKVVNGKEEASNPHDVNDNPQRFHSAGSQRRRRGRSNNEINSIAEDSSVGS